MADQNFRVKRGLEVGAGATVLVAESSGNIGIGSTQPTATLDVNGDINLTGTFYQNSSPFVASRWTAGTGDDIYRLNGNVGVGTTNPITKLDVNGTLNVTGISTFQNNVHILDDDRFRIGGQVGTFDGFELFHIGNNSYISDSGTGFLAVLSNQFKIKNAFDSEDIAIFNENGSVELYYDNSKKFETTGYGVTVSGGLNVSGVSTFQGNVQIPDDVQLTFGASNDLTIYHDASGTADTYIKKAGSGNLRIWTNQLFVKDSTGSESLIEATQNNSVDLYFDGSKKLNTTTNGIEISGIVTASSGIVTYYGDGSALTGISAGFDQDADGNLFAGTGAGGSYDPATGSACFNTFLGCNAGNNITSGDSNNFIGYNAGFCNTDGCHNNFLGSSAGYQNTGGYFNNFFGFSAGYASTTGSCNNFLGLFAGRFNTTGSCNNFFGAYAGNDNTEGTNNNFLGTRAGSANTTGSYNNFFGRCAGRYNTSGGNNNFFGNQAGRCNTIGTNNNFFGACAGERNTTTSDNNYFGACAGRYNTTGTNNNFLGWWAGMNSSGSCNNFFGCMAGRCNTGSTNNIFGPSAGFRNSGNHNNFFGFYTGNNNTTGSCNNFFGRNAGRNNTDGCNNNFFGRYTGCSQTSGNNNIAIGNNVQLPNTTGSDQLAIGRDSNLWISGNSNFDVGIGTTNPITKLDVTGNVAIGGSIYDANGTPGTDGQVLSNVAGVGVSWTDAGGGGGGGLDITSSLFL